MREQHRFLSATLEALGEEDGCARVLSELSGLRAILTDPSNLFCQVALVFLFLFFFFFFVVFLCRESVLVVLVFGCEVCLCLLMDPLGVAALLVPCYLLLFLFWFHAVRSGYAIGPTQPSFPGGGRRV